MTTTSPAGVPRRTMLAVPALVVAAVALIARPAQARPRTVECLADLIGTS
ncbi:hypothetical protein [Micromonospora echinaurantiaca]